MDGKNIFCFFFIEIQKKRPKFVSLDKNTPLILCKFSHVFIFTHYQSLLQNATWKSRINPSIYKRHSTAPVVNKEQCLYWTVGTGQRVGAVLA